LSEAEVLTRIREDRTILDPVRQRALSQVEAYGRGLVRRDSDRLVQSLSMQSPLKPDLLERIRTHPDLSPPLRQEALALVAHYVEISSLLNQRAQRIARERGKEPAEYRMALRCGQAACGGNPQEGSYLTTLGMAQYRVGDYQEAVDTLTRARELNAPTPEAPLPVELAFLVMALYRLEKKEESQATLRRLQEVMRKPPWAKQHEAQDFLREAEGVAAGQSSNPRK
jgi:tetratricopeptide (TPR) repeat protein